MGGSMQTQTEALKPLAYQVSPFCRMVGIGRSHFYNLVSRGKIRVIKLGNRTLVPASEAERLLAGGVAAE
jgi:excisionase family DNA binding protein